MKTKREVLESIIQHGSCRELICTDCPYDSIRCHDIFFRFGAMAILRQNRKKKEPRVFDESKILTCVNADQAKVGMRGYFADGLAGLKMKFNNNKLYKLLGVCDEGCTYRIENTIERVEE